jgi:hypothetical protein
MVSKARVAAGVLVLLLIFAVGLGTGVFVPRLMSFFQRAQPYSTATLLRQVQTVSELVTVKYVIEKVIILEDVKWVPGLGESRVLLLAHGVVKAGIDFQKMRPEDIQVNGKAVTIKLPPAQITEAYLDERQTRVIERTTGLLRTFDKDLEQNARVHALSDIRRAARSGDILKEADTRARTQLANLLKQLGFESVQFEN